MTFKPFLAALALIAVQASTHAAVTVGPCALYAGAGTGKAIASGATLDECAKAAKAAGTYTIKTPLTVAPDAVSIALTGLPDATTTARTASISYAASPASPVWCRLDSYAPIACPQPFVLGATPLAIGAHRVDFYAGATVPADLSKPTKSYSWVITAPPVVTPPVDPPPVVTSATALAVLPPVGWEGNGVDGYSGKSVIGSDGVPRLVVNADGTYTQRIKLGDPEMWGGNRAEFGWSGVQSLKHGVDYWFAFAIKPRAGEWHGNEPSTSDQIFFQIHQINLAACCGPTFAIGTRGAGNALWASRVYGPSPNGIEETIYVGTTNSRPPDGAWTRFVVHLRFGPDATYAPVIQVWQNGAPIVNRSGASAAVGQVGDSYYAKVGFYKWREAAVDYGLATTRAADYSPLYFGTGVDLKANADAALADL